MNIAENIILYILLYYFIYPGIESYSLEVTFSLLHLVKLRVFTIVQKVICYRYRLTTGVLNMLWPVTSQSCCKSAGVFTTNCNCHNDELVYQRVFNILVPLNENYHFSLSDPFHCYYIYHSSISWDGPIKVTEHWISDNFFLDSKLCPKIFLSAYTMQLQY